MSYSVIPSKVFPRASTYVRVLTVLLYLGSDSNQPNTHLSSIMTVEYHSANAWVPAGWLSITDGRISFAVSFLFRREKAGTAGLIEVLPSPG